MKYDDSDYKELIETHHFILEEEPIPDARPRARMIKKGAKAKPKRCEWCIATVYDGLSKEKKQIKMELKNVYGGKIHKTPKNKYKTQDAIFIEIDFKFYNKLPKASTKLNKRLAKLEVLRNINQKDTDNLIKLYMDCLHDVVYDNDCLVTKVSGEKLFTDTEDNERTEFVIRIYKYNLEE